MPAAMPYPAGLATPEAYPGFGLGGCDAIEPRAACEAENDSWFEIPWTRMFSGFRCARVRYQITAPTRTMPATPPTAIPAMAPVANPDAAGVSVGIVVAVEVEVDANVVEVKVVESIVLAAVLCDKRRKTSADFDKTSLLRKKLTSMLSC